MEVPELSPPGWASSSLEFQDLPHQKPCGTQEVLAQIQALTTTQTRMEAVLMDIREDLGALSLHLDAVGRLAAPPSPAQSEGGKAEEGGSTQRYLHHESTLALTPQPSIDESVRAQQSQQSKVEALEQAERELGQQRKHSLASEGPEPPPSLPQDWPACVRIRPAPQTGGRLRRKGGKKLETVVVKSEQRDSYFEEAMVRGKGWTRWIVVDPNSLAYTLYNVFFLLVLVHDVLHIPFSLAWDLQHKGVGAVAAWMSCVFWTVDVFVSCITGYSRAGKLELRLSVVAWRYARTWLVPDVTLNLCDWLGTITSSVADDESFGSVRLIRFLKLGKLLRLIGLLRTIKAVRLIEDLVENRFSSSARLLLQCFVFSISLLLVNHLIGCAWYAIGRTAPSDTGLRWIDMTIEWNGEHLRVVQHDLHHQYLSAIHWSMAQIVGGNMDIIAYNSYERVFNMLCMALGLIFGCSIVSMLSTSLVEYQVSKNDQIQKIRQLRRFLMENNISRGIASLVQQQASVRLSTQSKLQEEDVCALQLLSTSLRSTIRYERFNGHLARHALFRMWMSIDHGMVRELCMEAMDTTMLAPHDYLFEPGGKCSKAYCPMEGEVIYIQELATAPVHCTKTTSVELGHWICEAALWSHWVHVGRAAANAHSQVLSISSGAMMEVLQKHGPVAEVTAEYCLHYHRRIVAARPPHAPWPTDLEVPFTELSDLVVSMDTRVQVTIGLSALDQSLKGSADLQEEVVRGKSCVLINAKGEIERVVSVVVLHMTSLDGNVLVELGKIEEEVPIAGSCQLPGLKQEVGEMMNSTLCRLLARFHLQPEDVEMTRIEREVTWKNSKEFGVHTKYVRTIHHVKLVREIPIPALAVRPRSGALPRSQSRTSGDGFEFFSNAAQKSRRPSLAELGEEASSLRISKGSAFASALNYLVGPFYNVQSGNKNILYTWLDQEGFRSLKSPPGEQALNRWLTLLRETSLDDLADFSV